MLLLGIDLGTSSVKVSVVDAQTQSCIASAQYPEVEVAIDVPQPGFAEQSAPQWWQHVQAAILKCNETRLYNPADIAAIGIAYQMHGLVMVDAQQNVLRKSIIWCDGRAVQIGNEAFAAMGEEHTLKHLLNSPGNFTASKLAWVKQNEPAVYKALYKFMLPGDYISMMLTGAITTTASALSEGILWDFVANKLSDDVMAYYGFNAESIPNINPLFSEHGTVTPAVANALSLKAGIPVTYKAGDQLNNAFSLNVLEPGEVAATAGTSGVIYAVSDNLTYDSQTRVNSFAHVNHTAEACRIGTLLCINGTGSCNRWVKQTTGSNLSYQQLNAAAAAIEPGANNLLVLPFGNGAERMLNNRDTGAQIINLDFNTHTPAHISRAAQEGIAFAFRYGLDCMRENNITPRVMRAGKANLFLSDVFTQAFVNATGVPVELHQTDGSVGAAIGAGVGAGFYPLSQAFTTRRALETITATNSETYNELYQQWKAALLNLLSKPL